MEKNDNSKCRLVSEKEKERKKQQKKGKWQYPGDNNMTLCGEMVLYTLHLLVHFFSLFLLLSLSLAAIIFTSGHFFRVWASKHQIKRHVESLLLEYYFFVFFLFRCAWFLFSLSHAYTLNMIAAWASMCHLSRLTVCVYVLWPLVFLWAGSISFISLFPLWNKSHNDSKEQVAFRWHSVRYEIESYITISTSVLFCVHVCIYIIAILCTAHTSTWWFVYINCQLFLSNWVIFLYINVECMLFLLYRTSLAFFRFWLFFYHPAFYFHFQLAWFPAVKAN